ncbi:MAG: hypothetical protein AB7N76_19615 [Planctomycetota bacterium]
MSLPLRILIALVAGGALVAVPLIALQPSPAPSPGPAATAAAPAVEPPAARVEAPAAEAPAVEEVEVPAVEAPAAVEVEVPAVEAPTPAPAPQEPEAPASGRKLRRLRNSEVTPEITANAKRILAAHRSEPFGTEVPFVAGGEQYVGRIERHYHPPGGALKPWGYHPGVSVLAVVTDPPQGGAAKTLREALQR